MLPNTFVIGAMKSATTSLCAMLNQHPQVFVSAIKEPDFFSRDEVFAKGVDWYGNHFEPATEQRVVLEGSTSYTKHIQYPKAAERLAAQIPDARLIYILRHPVARIESHWQHEVLKNRTELGVDQFAREHEEAIDISCYWKQLNIYRDLFPDNQIQVLFLDDLRAQPQETLQSCSRFLDLDPFEFSVENGNQNRSENRRLDAWPIRIFRKYRWFDTKFEMIKQSVPSFIHPMMKAVLKSNRQPPRQKLNRETRRWVEEQLIEDTHELLRHHKKKLDFWEFTTMMPVHLESTSAD